MNGTRPRGTTAPVTILRTGEDNRDRQLRALRLVLALASPDTTPRNQRIGDMTPQRETAPCPDCDALDGDALSPLVGT
jgi:hypothetical protein